MTTAGARLDGRRALVRGLPLGPAVLLGLFLGGPIAYCVYSAFTDTKLTGASGKGFVGFDNFTKAFTSAEFGASLWYTVFFTVVSAIIGQNVLGMGLALLMRSGSAIVRGFVSAVVIGSWVLPEVVAGYLWVTFLGKDGTANALLAGLGIPTQNWLFTTPILAVSIANIWRGTAFSMLVYSAALSEVPKDVVEAATVDGASTWRTLWSITLPMIRRSIATNLMLITLQTLSVFGLIWTMTKGGPSNKSETLPLFAYQQAFQFSQLGYGTALALVLLLIGGVFSVIYLRVLRLEGIMTTEASARQPAVAIARPVAAASRGPNRWASKGVVNGVLLLIGACYLLPLIWLVTAAFDAHAGLSISWPAPWTFDNFRAVLNVDTTYRPMLNGLLLCGGGTIVTMVCAVLAAYPLSRYRSRFKRPFLLTVLFMTGLPITAIMVPVYGMFVQLNLIDTYPGTILFMATTALPIAIWLSKNFMDSVPIELEEAAWTDGASPMQALRRVVLPLMWPGLSVVALYVFIGLWGNFFVPFVLLLSNDQLPASVSIYTFFSQYTSVVYGQLAAYSMLYSLPAVLLYLVLARRLGGAFTFGGAVKG